MDLAQTGSRNQSIDRSVAFNSVHSHLATKSTSNPMSEARKARPGGQLANHTNSIALQRR